MAKMDYFHHFLFEGTPYITRLRSKQKLSDVSMPGRLEVHFSLYVSGYTPGLASGGGPAMAIKVTTLTHL